MNSVEKFGNAHGEETEILLEREVEDGEEEKGYGLSASLPFDPDACVEDHSHGSRRVSCSCWRITSSRSWPN